MALKYNPLLKIGLENTGGDSSEIEAQIAALQNSIDSLQSSLNTLQSNLNLLKNSKITKVTASEQLSSLSVGEIFEWQAASTETFTQGYFYKVVSSGVYSRVNLQPNYTLPIAAANSLGGIKIGSGLNIDETGVLSITGGDSLKVPRCSTQAQVNALTDNDIFQWQGATTADYVQGYFYKKTSNTTVEVVAGDYYVKVSSSHERTLGIYSIKQGYYSFVENKTTPWEGYCQSYNPSVSSYRYYTNYPAVVGQKVAKCSNHDLSSLQLVEWVTVASIDENGKPATFSDGAVYNQYSASYGNIGNLAIFQAVDGTQIGVGISVQNNINVVGMIFAIDNGVWYPVNFYCSLIKTQAATDITVTTIITAQTNTQPQPTNGSGLTVTFTPDTSAIIKYINSGDTLATIAQKISKIITITPSFIAMVANPTRLRCTLCCNVLFLSAYELQFQESVPDFGKICSFPNSLKFKLDYNYGIYANTTTHDYVNTIYVGYSDVENYFFLSIRGSVAANQSISFSLTCL